MMISTKAILAFAILSTVGLLAGCGGNATPPPAFVQADASNTNVTVQIGGSSRPLQPPASAQLQAGDGVQVDASGRALLRFSDFLTVEVLRTGDLQVRQLDLSQQSALAVFGQSGGAFVNDLAPGAGGVTRRVTVESGFAVITATGTRFMVVKEANSPLEWVFGLDAGANDLTVQSKNDPSRSNPTIKPVVSGVARWIAPVGEPSAGIGYDVAAVDAWLANVERGDPVPEVGEVLWPHADARIGTDSMTGTLQPGMSMDMGGVTVAAEKESAFGRAKYTPMDCNGDGIDDVQMENGIIRLDFRTLLSRVRGLDVTLMAGAQTASGSVTVFDPAMQPINRQPFEVAPGQGEIVSMRADVPYHYAEIAITNGCFLGFSLTPPGPDDARAKPVPAVDVWPPRPAVARPTATPSPTPAPVYTRPTPEPVIYRPGTEMKAVGGNLKIDGNTEDWQLLARQTGAAWLPFDTIVYDNGCQNVYPNAYGEGQDLSGRVMFAYDDAYLYVAFVVEDDGFVGYTDSDLNFFRSDAPQLLLDLDLAGDASLTTNDGDDKQLDFRVGVKAPGDSPAITFWDLGPRRARSRLLDAPVAAVATDSGYFLEVAIPWYELGLKPVAGLRLGLAASVSDNDTPGTNVQECMISTASERKWENPTTWGVLTLGGR